MSKATSTSSHTLDETLIADGVSTSNRAHGLTRDSDSVTIQIPPTPPNDNDDVQEPSTRMTSSAKTTHCVGSKLSLKERLKLRKVQKHLEQEQELLQQLNLDANDHNGDGKDGNGRNSDGKAEDKGSGGTHSPSKDADTDVQSKANDIRRNQSDPNTQPNHTPPTSPKSHLANSPMRAANTPHPHTSSNNSKPVASNTKPIATTISTTTVKRNGVVDADTLYITATTLCKQRKFLKAETVCRRALKLDPHHKDIIFRLAGLMLPKDLAAAEKLYRDALTIDPNCAKFMTHLAKVLSALKRNKEAEAWYRQALVVSPNDPVAPLMLATLLRGRGEKIEAETFCRRAISQAHTPTSYKRKAQAMFILANLLTEKGELYVAEAEELYTDVLKIEPTNEGALNNLAVLFKEKGQKEDAESLYRRALTHNIDHVPTMHNLANLLRGYGEYTEAELFSRRCLELDPNHIGSLKNVCVMLEMREEYNESERLRRHLFVHSPNDAHNLGKLARLALVKGKLTEAEHFCRMSLDVDAQESIMQVLVKVLEAKAKHHADDDDDNNNDDNDDDDDNENDHGDNKVQFITL